MIMAAAVGYVAVSDGAATGTPLIDTVLTIGTVVAAIAAPTITWFIARRKQPLDKAAEKKINTQITLMGTAIEARRMKRLMRLEAYIDADIPYHRKLNELLAQFVPAGDLPVPPRLPDYDVDDEGNEDDETD